MKLSIDDTTVEQNIKEATKEYLQEHGLLPLLRQLIKQEFNSWIRKTNKKGTNEKLMSLHSRITHLDRRIKKLEGEEYTHIPED